MSTIQLPIHESSNYAYSSASEAVPQMTPVTPADNEDIYDRSAMDVQWREAIREATKDLRPNEQMAIRRFSTPEELLEDLKKLQQEREADEGFQRLIYAFRPYLTVVKDLASLLLLHMRPYTVEIGVMWGLMHLAISAASRYQQTQSRLASTQGKIQHCLQVFQHFTSDDSIGNDKLLRHALVDMFIAMVNLWVATNAALRSCTQDRIFNTLKTIESDFERTLKHMEDAVARIRELAIYDHLRKRDVDARMTMQLPSIDVGNINYHPALAHVAHFVGREATLKDMAKHFESDELHDPRIVVLYGMGGIGKTALAFQYATQCKRENKFAAIFKLDAENDITIRKSFDQLARDLGVPSSTSDDAILKVKNIQNKLSDAGQRWLMIADNVEHANVLLQYLPSRGGAIIVTTRYPGVAYKGFVGSILRIELGSFDEQDGVQLLNELLGEYNASLPDIGDTARSSSQGETEQLPSSLDLLRKFDGHPLAIELLAAYMGQNNYSVADMTRKLDRSMKYIRQSPGAQVSHHNLVSLFELHFIQIKGRVEGHLLALMTLLYPTEIPESIFEFDENREIFERFGIEDQDDIEDGLQCLVNLNLIKRWSTYLSVHRIVQDAFQHSEHGLDGQLQEPFNAVCSLVFRLYPKVPGSTSHAGKWAECNKILTHAVSIIDGYDQSQRMKKKLILNDDFLQLLQHTTWFLWEIGDYSECKKYVGVAKACSDPRKVPQHIAMHARYCSTLASIYKEQNNLKKCRENLEQVRRIYQTMLPANDPYWSHCYGNMGGLLHAEGRYKEALEHFDLATDVCVNNGAPPEGEARYNMGRGRTRYAQGKYAEATQLYDRAWDQLNSPTARPSPWLKGFLMYDRGNVQVATKNYEEAKASYEQAINLGRGQAASHPLVAAMYCKLGIVQAALGSYDEAIETFDKGLAIVEFRGVMGEVARITHHKAAVLRQRSALTPDDEEQAKQMEQRAQELKLQVANEQEQDGIPDDSDTAFDHGSSRSKPNLRTDDSRDDDKNAYKNQNILAESRLAAANWTDPNGLTHRFIFFQDPSSAIIARRWDSQNHTWATTNLTTGMSSTRSPISSSSPSTPLTSFGLYYQDVTNELRLYYLTPENTIAVIGLYNLTYEPNDWEMGPLTDVRQATIPGSQLASAWSRCSGYSCGPGWGLLLYQRPDGALSVLNTSEPHAPATVLESRSVARNSSLAMTPQVDFEVPANGLTGLSFISESLETPDSGIAQQTLYLTDHWESWDSVLHGANLPPPSPKV
ncbi:hypothetical protein O1611_g1539 [Lasiodiplodia mahajangana]|uniref:Uncharacterized protein n=1 Tax=Lasiodiplodia mahajangana TaxID=1108764 RepID=A0ACC2JX64_9PEZI|nr:hypothetical protein O1611_g1539 [Lasiodiplodia mahajangana]